MAKKRSRATVPRPDDDPFKKLPNGLRATLTSIRKYGRKDIAPGPGQSRAAFAKKFLKTYNDVAAHYGKKLKTERTLARVIAKLEGNGEREVSGVNFFQLRAYADFVGIPTGLLLIFSQVVTHEAKGRSRDYIAAYLARCRSALTILENLVGETTDTEPVFHVPVTLSDGTSGFLARPKGLSKIVAAYNGRKQ